MKFWYTPPTNSNEVVDSFGGYQPNQPSQKYPFKPIQSPRVDNKNQPWYGGQRWWGKGPDSIQYTDAVANYASAISPNPQTNYKLKDVWSYLNDWFGGATAKYNLRSASSLPGNSNSMGMSQQSAFMQPTGSSLIGVNK